MTQKTFRWRVTVRTMRHLVAVICVVLLAPGDMGLLAMQGTPPQPPSPQATEEAPKTPQDQLDSLVAPIALYPDPLLSQTLVASTYPLEIIQLQQWLEKNTSLKGDALTQAAMQQDWDPSIQAMVVFPDVVRQLADNIKWTTDLGNAFLAQQADVMEAVQRMRSKAQGTGNLKSNAQMRVETRVIEKEPVIIIEQSSPDVVYVPSYDPMVVYGAPAYPYPPMVYPPGYYAAGMALSFGVGIAIGAAWGHGGWGWNCGWGGNNNININRNNNFINNSNRQNVSNRPGGGGNNWQHNPKHRGGAPYGDRATAKQYGGNVRGDSMANRQATARQSQRSGMRNASERSGFGGPQQGGMGDRSAMGRQQGFSGGGERVGNRQVSNTPRGGGENAFGGGGKSGGLSGSSARASSSRGSSSMGGGGRRGGGGGRRR